MNLENLQNKIKHRYRQIRLADEEMQEVLDRQSIDAMYMHIYGALLNYFTTDWQDEAWSGTPKPPLKCFMKNFLSKESFDFWDMHKDTLFDVDER